MRFGIFISLGLLHIFIGLLLAGAGHGWTTGFYFSIFSCLALCLIPFFPLKKNVSFSLLFLNIILTVFLVKYTMNEDMAYFVRVWNSVPVLVLLYFSLWLLWPATAFIRLVRK